MLYILSPEARERLFPHLGQCKLSISSIFTKAIFRVRSDLLAQIYDQYYHVSVSLSPSLSFRLSLSVSISPSRALALALSLSHTHKHTHFHARTHVCGRSHACIYAITYALARAHAHAHTLIIEHVLPDVFSPARRNPCHWTFAPTILLFYSHLGLAGKSCEVLDSKSTNVSQSLKNAFT